jgi:type VI secretion system protein ImpH
VDLRSRCAEGLERILEAQFGLRFRLRPFVGRWLKRSAGEPSVIGARLGRSTILGDRVWDVQSKFRLELGPVSQKDFRRFLPKTGKDWAALKAWVNGYVGLEYDWDLHLILDPSEVPAFQLSRDPQQGVLLGVTTWQKSSPSRPLGREADDLIIDSFR